MDGQDALAGALERLPGVLAATALNEPPHGPRVYLAISADADGDALRGAALGILRDHGLTAPADRIHVGTAPAKTRAPTALPRFSLEGLDIQRSDNRVRCTVTLRAAARTMTGSAEEPDTRSGRARAAVRASLAACGGLDPDLRLGLEGVRVADLFGHETALVLIEATAGRTHVHLPGAALVERSVEESSCLATLGALRSWTVTAGAGR